MVEIIHGRRITTQVYYDGGIARSIEQIEDEKFTDRNGMLRDVIDALSVLTSGQTDNLELQIQVDKKGRYLLTKRWTV